jgi:hypothetical protein
MRIGKDRPGLFSLSLLGCGRLVPARPMGFPPPLVPHAIHEPRRPLPTERWDWVVCRNALWVNKLWSAIYPYHAWGHRPQSTPSSCPKARKILLVNINLNIKLIQSIKFTFKTELRTYFFLIS